MRAVFNHDELKNALAKASKATGRKTNLLPILTHVALEVDADRVGKMVASDGIQRVELELDVERVTTPGSIAVDAGLLGSFLASTSGPVDLELASNLALTARAGKARARIHGMNVEDMPYFASEAQFIGGVSVDTGEFKSALTAALTSVAGDESRPALAGVHVQRRGEGALILESADGYRATRIELEPLEGAGEGDVLIPATSLRSLASLTPDGAVVGLEVAPNLVRATVDTGVQWATAVIEGQFPDMVQLIPREFAYEVEVERKALQNALKAAAPFIRDSNHHIELESVTGLTVDGERESALELVGVSVDREIGRASCRERV